MPPLFWGRCQELWTERGVLTGDCWEGGESEELLTLRGAKTMVLVLFIFALLSLFVFCYASCFLLFTFDIFID
jgi:hypothetical protein